MDQSVSTGRNTGTLVKLDGWRNDHCKQDQLYGGVGQGIRVFAAVPWLTSRCNHYEIDECKTALSQHHYSLRLNGQKQSPSF